MTDYNELADGCDLAATTDALAGNIMAQLALKGAAKAIRSQAREIERLNAEIALLRRRIPATFDNGICLVCGVAHCDTGMPCPSLRVTALAAGGSDE